MAFVTDGFTREPSGGGSSTFLGLEDTPDSYSGMTSKAVTVNTAGTGLSFTTQPSLTLPLTSQGDLLVHTGIELARLPAGDNGQVLTANDVENPYGVQWKTPSSGSWSSSNLTALTRGAMQSLLSWESPYDATRTNVIEWDVETHDGLGVWSAEAPKLITIAASGWYSIAAHLPAVMNSWTRASILADSDNWSAGAGVFLDGVTHCIHNGDGSLPKVHVINIPATYLTAGTVLRLALIGTAGGNTMAAPEGCKLWIQKLA